MKIEYRPYRARSMINRLKHVDDWFWVSYTLNPYRGCAHLCVYCDARANQYGLSETFEQVVYYKENAVEVLERQLPRLKRGIVGTGGVCDAYQPVEAERRITRRIKEASQIMGIELIDHVIVTKEGWYSFAEEGEF